MVKKLNDRESDPYHHTNPQALMVYLTPIISLFVFLMKGTVPHPQFLHAFITLKPGKYLPILDNYRPFALLNSDYKMFTQIFANRLLQLLSALIHRDQVGFVPTRHSGDNIRQTIDLIDLLTRMKHPALVLSQDAQKAFDYSLPLWFPWPIYSCSESILCYT